jgi:ribosome maturation factor RimP
MAPQLVTTRYALPSRPDVGWSVRLAFDVAWEVARMATQRRRGTGTKPGAGGGKSGGAHTRPGGVGPAPGADLAARRARLCEIVEPVVAKAGYDLEDLSVARVGRRHLVRVVVDGDHGVSLEAIAELSRAISPALDAAESAGGEFMEREYQLEVSSPGIDRPLTQARHWRRNVGRRVHVTVEGRALDARILSADDEAVVLGLGGTDEAVPYDRLGPGRVQIEFTRLDDLSDDDLDQIDGEDEDDEEGKDEA